MMEKYQRQPYNRTLREAGRPKKYLQMIGYQRSGEKLD
jgi:hypothetical protein